MKKRPVNLNLTTIKFPITALISIMHRISGLFLLLLVPVSIYIFSLSLESEQGFLAIKSSINNFYVKLTLWIILTAFSYHFLAGIRHLFMDMHLGESLRAGKITSYIVAIISILSSLFFLFLIFN